VTERWATFDCYGTLIDWMGGIRSVLADLFPSRDTDELLHRYHEIEPELQREQPQASYREILTQALPRLAPLPADEHDALARSLPSWQPFPEVRAALDRAEATLAADLEKPLGRYIYPPSAFTPEQEAAALEGAPA
jgi:2-haloacid dehalogenase